MNAHLDLELTDEYVHFAPKKTGINPETQHLINEIRAVAIDSTRDDFYRLAKVKEILSKYETNNATQQTKLPSFKSNSKGDCSSKQYY